MQNIVDVWKWASFVHSREHVDHSRLKKVRRWHYSHGQCEAFECAEGHDNCEDFFASSFNGIDGYTNPYLNQCLLRKEIHKWMSEFPPWSREGIHVKWGYCWFDKSQRQTEPFHSSLGFRMLGMAIRVLRIVRVWVDQGIRSSIDKWAHVPLPPYFLVELGMDLLDKG